LQVFMAHVSPMIDWEDLAQRHVTEIQRALPEPIRTHAMEVPVFFSRTMDDEDEGGEYLGLFEGYSLVEGPPTRPDEMPRITLFIETLALGANYQKTVFLHEVRITYLHELGHYLGWDEEQIERVGL
jgi:predicted Zn-dependent protease with MMP-like domain